jgi:hypothetical protein
VKLLYAETVCKVNAKPLKRPLVRKVFTKTPKEEEERKMMDPFDPMVFGAEIQTAIISHLDKRDLLKMTEVSRMWKNLVEMNRLLNDLKLRVELGRQNPNPKPGSELNSSLRQYKDIEIVYNSNDRESCFNILRKFARSIETATIHERETASPYPENEYSSFTNLRCLNFSSFINDEMCRFLGLSEFENLETLYVRRRGKSESLVIFLHEIGSLTRLFIAADSQFYRSWFGFVDGENYAPEMFLEELHVEIIDYCNNVVITAFQPQFITLTSLKFSGICKFLNITQALMIFPNLEYLDIGFTEQDSDANEIEEAFSDDLEHHSSLTKLVVRDIHCITVKAFKLLLLYLPQLAELKIVETIISREIIESVIMLPTLEKLTCKYFESEAFEYFLSIREDNENHPSYNASFEIVVD